MSNNEGARDLNEVRDLRIPASISNLAVMPGDDKGKADAIAKIRAFTGKTKEAPQVEHVEPVVGSNEPQGVIDEPQEVAPPLEGAQQTVSKRSLKADDLDEIIVTIDGEDKVLTSEELKRGAAFLAANNKRAEELARDRKFLEAEKTALAVKASKEVNDLTSEIATREQRNSQLDEWLEYAYRNNYTALNLPDGKKNVSVAALENERKANELAIRRSQTKAKEKQAEIEAQQASFREAQRAILLEKDPDITNRLDDIASYLERSGFDRDDAQLLINAKAELVLLLDKARRFDNALNSTPEKKKASQTKVISKSGIRSEASAPTINSNVDKWQQVVNSARPGSSEYINALRNIRQTQRSQSRR